MAWPYEFITLTDEEKHLRRLSLDQYASLAHWSAFAPIPLILLLQLAKRVVRVISRRARDDGGEYQQVPGSPLAKARHMAASGELAARWRRFIWWMGDDIFFFGEHRGQRDEWVLGAVWMAWLLALCVVGTGRGKNRKVA